MGSSVVFSAFSLEMFLIRYVHFECLSVATAKGLREAYSARRIHGWRMGTCDVVLETIIYFNS